MVFTGDLLQTMSCCVPVHGDAALSAAHRSSGQTWPGRSVRPGLAVRPSRWRAGLPTLMSVWTPVGSMWADPAVTDPPARPRRDRILAALVLAAAAVEAGTRPDLGWRPAALAVSCALAFAVLV